MLELAEAQALAGLGADEQGAAIVTAGEDWAQGVVGLVASRLKERFGRPAFAIAFTGDVGTGSARSIAGVDLGRVVRAGFEAGHLVKGGGHAMAAGLTIERRKLAAFKIFLDEAMRDKVAAARADRALLVDAALTASASTPALVAEIEKAGPFGSGNPEPVFVFPAHRIVNVTQVGADHLRVRAQAGDGAYLDAMAFRAVGGPLGAGLMAARGGSAHLAAHLSLDRWGGKERVQARLVDVAPARAGRS
jgi:single-stranded-DNA-specific exonuclease